MAYPVLPAEIIEDHIIDKLAKHAPSLRSCALVCRAWVIASQKRLFSRIELRASNSVTGDALCGRFRDLLAASPHIALHVSDLSIADGMENRRWMIRSRQTLSTIFPTLVNINKFSVAFVTLPWSEASSLRNTLRDVFRHPSIRTIIIRGLSHLPSWDDLFYMLNGCRANHVLLYAVTLDPVPSARASRRRRGPAIQRPRVTIGSLETNSSSQDLEDFAFWADNPRSCIDISSLPKFSFDLISIEDIAGCNPVLRSDAFRELHTFEVAIEDTAIFRDVVTAQLDLGRVRHIQLTVKEIPYSSAELGNVLRWYAHVFNTSRSQSIEEVTLTCVQWARVNQNASLEEQLTHWRSLDAVLARVTPNLRSVYLKTESEFPIDVRDGKAFLETRVAQMFPVLLERGILNQF